VVVTGAGSGIGRAISRRFARDGAKLALLGRGEEALDGVREEVEAEGGSGLVITVDVADAKAVDEAAERIEDELGPIDIWVNDAMTTVFAFFEQIEPKEYERATDVTYHGTVWGTRAALERMAPRDQGTIVQVGSAMAYQGIPLQAPYSGAKHAMKGFVDSLRTELRHKGSKVHVTMVQLPGVNTPQFEHGRSKMDGHPMPVPPVYQPEVAADAVHWAARHRRREVYVGVPTVYTILGSKLAPWLAERYLARTAVDGQQTETGPTEANRKGNLMKPPAEDPGAHGPFDGIAHSHSIQWWLSRHRGALAGALAAGAVAAAAGLLAANR
jgi:NAD(P)-dependent dehydrogenase (short-subunit alcohol dehydrogenase family)